MQVTLKCKVSLSKKMRSLLQNGASIVLTADSINSGKGEGLLVLSDESSNQDITDLLGKETSIQITPTEVSQGGMNASVSKIYQGGQQNPGVSQVFSEVPPQDLQVPTGDSGPPPQYQQSPLQQPLQQYPPQYHQPPQQYYPPQQPQYQQRTAVDRLAAQQPPDHGQNNRAYYTHEEQVVPQQFSQTQNPSFIDYIKNYEELITAVNESKDKVSNINIDPITDMDSMGVRRQKAILQEQKDMQESIGRDAYVVNERCASLTINDIGLDLPLRMPKNLGNLSAKTLASSRQLWDLFRKDYIRLISPKEADNFLKNAGNMSETYVPELEIYDSHIDAEDAAYDSRNGRGAAESRATVFDLERDLDGPSEEMRMLKMASGSQAPSRPALGGGLTSLSGNTRRSYHGAGAEDPEYLTDIHASPEFEIDRRNVGRESRRNSQGIKTIASRHSSRRY
jgi:hypothetical protein